MIFNLTPKKSAGGLPEKAALSAMSWEDISAVSQAGLAAEYWSVGDAASVLIGGTAYDVVIVGFAHDELADGTGRAGITFGLKQCLSSSYKMNSAMSNAGGWSSCELRATLNSAIFEQLPSDLRGVIRPVSKTAASGGDEGMPIDTVTDSLFLFSEIEVIGDTSGEMGDGYVENSWEGEGSQYPYYATAANRQKTQSGTAISWWTRSLAAYTSEFFCTVNKTGAAATGEASGNAGVSFGFCV